MLPSILARQLQTGIKDYIETTFPMTNEPFIGSLDRFANTEDALYHEPYINISMPFRTADKMPDCFKGVEPAFKPHMHQNRAFERLAGDDIVSTIIATGTGSGKTECFLYPILDYCYRHRGEPGIKALIIYPMNALASDQAKRIAEFIYNSPKLKNEISVGMYVGGTTGHESMMMTEDSVIADRQTMLNNPPDILLTNYKMLDYLLIRPKDARLWENNKPDTLKFIAVDELHTFDGAQGTDLACLLRRLKARLYTPVGHLCCIGTSATIGSGDSDKDIIRYASEIFGEHFDKNSIVMEDRLSPDEFLAKAKVSDYKIPTNDEVSLLKKMSDDEKENEYLKAAADSWLTDFSADVLTDDGRVALSAALMQHSVFQALCGIINGKFCRNSEIIEQLSKTYSEVTVLEDADSAINALTALVSHARIRVGNKLRPFLSVNVQLWIKELARMVGRVSDSNVEYALSDELNQQQKKLYLPVVNCRECGMTGWVSRVNESNMAVVSNLQAFYNSYFEFDSKIQFIYPKNEMFSDDFLPAQICPDCLKIKFGEHSDHICEKCGGTTFDVCIPNNITAGGGKNKKYICPCCGSKRGISIIGLRSATEISTEISQIFSSGFNDDKKTLAFSDNVQDAAHRAGFFNSRTWKFGIRSAMQNFVNNGGNKLSLDKFKKECVEYYHREYSNEDYVAFFIAPNMTWIQSYEKMLADRKFPLTKDAKSMMTMIDKRFAYEIMLEYGLTSNIGRTLEKSRCSILEFDKEAISEAADKVMLRVSNELGVLQTQKVDTFARMIYTLLDIFKNNGAFDDDAYFSFLKNGMGEYLLSNSHEKWMPGIVGGKNCPKFIISALHSSKKIYNYEFINGKKIQNALAGCCDEIMVDYSGIAEIIAEELVKSEILTVIKEDYADILAINEEKAYITSDAASVKCDSCGSIRSVPRSAFDIICGGKCNNPYCSGTYEEYTGKSQEYYGKLFSKSVNTRINAKDHTGLLERDERETLEKDFKRDKEERKIWDPNVISCTPTLEMGIDIGDLSTVIMCSVPPTQSQYIQRSGRAGRKDGNSLTMTVANTVPHDLYFYADPVEMIAGDVRPPHIFLKATAVLERQFIAYCFDCWIKTGVTEKQIPDKLGVTLNKLPSRNGDAFPFNFLNNIQSNVSSRVNSFISMFSEFDEAQKDDVRNFVRGNEQSPLHIKVLEAFEDILGQREAICKQLKDLEEYEKTLDAQPDDSSFEEEKKNIKTEKSALRNVIKEINDKYIFNFMSDEGLIPNYAFPEAGIVLKAILTRTASEENDAKKNKTEKSVYEYNRSASSAISEFAPNNVFYADGKKYTIDQIDVSSSKIQKWRLCPNCSHAELEIESNNTASCPECGSVAWSDKGQVREMLKAQMVYSNARYSDSLIGDESDDRTKVFFNKQLLVEVKEKDIISAFCMNNDEFNFGYEFVKKSILREINFGEASETTGCKVVINGEESVRKGFSVCRNCGKIQTGSGEGKHTYFCKTRKGLMREDDQYSDCLFLYRQFETEVLRLLIPETADSIDGVRTESFIAAFMLGMREYFGNVDHLRATCTQIPVDGETYRKQYLVVYDSVPGGTGYLKQLMEDENSLISIFEKSLEVMENCSCKNDPSKDGCYHCLYAYSQSRKIGSISRSTAIHMIKAILSGKDKIEKIKTIGTISTNSLFDSELERKFVETFSLMNNSQRKVQITKSLVNNKAGYILKINDIVWEIEPQVSLDRLDGVSVKCKPDFIIRPITQKYKKPVAVFTDGFHYHKDRIADDTLKREAIRRSGRFVLWSLSYDDVSNAVDNEADISTRIIDCSRYPMYQKSYKMMLDRKNVSNINPDKKTSFELLMYYLENERSEEILAAHASAYAYSLINPQVAANREEFNKWDQMYVNIKQNTEFTDKDYLFAKTIFGTYVGDRSRPILNVYSALGKGEDMVTVFAVLNDKADADDNFKKQWNGFIHFSNLMQFNSEYIAVTVNGIENMIYSELDSICDFSDNITVEENNDEWNDILAYVFDDSAINFINNLRDCGGAVPDAVGYEFVNDMGETIAEAELAWTDKKECWLTSEQFEYADIITSIGWKIINKNTEGDDVNE